MLKQRVITAIVLVIVFLSALFGLPAHWFSLFVGGVILLASSEWANLSALSRGASFFYSAIMAALMAALFSYLGLWTDTVNLDAIQSLLLSACLWWTIALLWVQGYPSSALLWGNKPVRLLMGVFVLIPAWLSMSWLVTLDTGRWFVILVILTVACADIGGYFFGRAFGKHKLAVNVSPGKTLEGFGGGIVCVLVVISIVIALSPSQHHLWLQWLIIVVFTQLASVLGDLQESMVKRHRGIKDSGSILPGHGGVLDRIDGLTAALPVFTLLYLLLIYLPINRLV